MYLLVYSKTLSLCVAEKKHINLPVILNFATDELNYLKYIEIKTGIDSDMTVLREHYFSPTFTVTGDLLL
jgi:hypothetical protein